MITKNLFYVLLLTIACSAWLWLRLAHWINRGRRK